MLSVIILTFNSIRFIKPCLDSVFSQGHQDLEVIVVDNASQDSTLDFVKENYSQVILIENKENLGAAKARNQGIEIAQGQWILTLDSDVILEKNFLNKISNCLKEHGESIAIFQPKILNMDKKTIYSCGIYLSKLRRFYDIGKGRLDNGYFNAAKHIFGACSAAAIFRKDVLEEIKEDTGYFDERFFFLVEDVDLAWRAQRRGRETLFCPEAICYHFGSSSGYDKKFRQYLCFRNRYLMMFKNDNKDITKWFSFMVYDITRICYLLYTNRFVLKTLKSVLKKIIQMLLIRITEIFYFARTHHHKKIVDYS